MPRDITVTFADGSTHVYQNAPDTVTPDQVSARAQQEFSKPVASLDGGRPQQPPGLLSRVKSAAESVIEPALTIATGAAAAPIGNIAGAAREAFTGDFGRGTAEATAKRIAEALTYRPRSQGGRENLTAIGNALSASKLEGLPWAGAELPALAQAVKQQIPALPAAGQMLAQTPEVSAARGALVKGLTGDVNPETAALAAKFQDLGGKVPLHALTENRPARMVGEWLDKLPLSGSTQPGNRVAFNQEILRQIGGDPAAGLVTPASFAPAMKRSGAAIGEVYNRAAVPLDAQFQDALKGLSDAQRLQVKDVRGVVKNYIEDIQGMAGPDGVIPGAALRAQDSAIGARLRSLPPGDLRGQLSDLQETLRDALARNISPDDAQVLGQARKQYAIGKMIEPLVAKSGSGGISPQALMGREAATAAGKNRMAMGASGTMGDLANIGQQFLKEQPSSGTAERGILAGLILDSGKAAAGLTAGNLYNRLGPRVAAQLLALRRQPTARVQAPLELAPPGPLELGGFAPRPYQDRGLLSLAEENAPVVQALRQEPDNVIDFPLTLTHAPRKIVKTFDMRKTK